jgi:hypothetical protein
MSGTSAHRTTASSLRETFRRILLDTRALDTRHESTGVLDVAVSKLLVAVAMCEPQRGLPDAERSVYPDGVPLYDQTYKDRLGTYRTAYQKMHGTLPKAWSDEDYSAVRYFKEVWGPIRAASSVPITTHYLRQKDQALFHALDHYIRQSQKGVRDRQMLTFEDLGILTERAAAKRVLARDPAL